MKVRCWHWMGKMPENATIEPDPVTGAGICVMEVKNLDQLIEMTNEMDIMLVRAPAVDAPLMFIDDKGAQFRQR